MLRTLMLALLLAATVAAPARALEPPVHWTAAQRDGIHTLTHDGSAELLGRPTPYLLTFTADPTETPDVHGVVGFELRLDAVAALPFPFDDFEGPDAPSYAQDSMTLTVERRDGTRARWTFAPAGWIPDMGAFAFGATAMTKLTDSVPRRVLDALAAGADVFEIRIAPAGDASKALVLRVPVADQQAAFKALVAHAMNVPASPDKE